MFDNVNFNTLILLNVREENTIEILLEVRFESVFETKKDNNLK